jgi:serine/threonine protein kinase
MENDALPLGTYLRDDKAYVIESVLGQGGFGITYKAKDQLSRPVAIKEFFPGSFCRRQNQEVIKVNGFDHIFNYHEYRDKFFDEAKRIVKLKHTNIVKVLDVFKANNTAYLVMEYEEGQTLEEMIRSKVYFNESETIKSLIDVAHALEYTHTQSILHRDVKPSNIIMRKDGKPVLIDFGAARENSSNVEEHTAILSHGFAPPEQYSKTGKKGPFVDVYGLAATCYYCLTGSVPIRADHRLEKRLPDPIEINPRVSETFNSIIVKGMELEVDNRYPSISKFIYDLTAVNLGNQDELALTEEQQKALAVTKEFLADRESNVLIITGGVHSGKTTVIKKALHSSRVSDSSFKVLAIGSRVAERISITSGLEVSSIYGHIYEFGEKMAPKKRSVDESGNDKIETIKQIKYNLKSNDDGDQAVYFIDEAHLLSDSFNETELFLFGSGKLLNDLLHFIDIKKNPWRKIILVGDDKRLYRGTKDEAALSLAHLENRYKLKVKSFELTQQISNDSKKTLLENLRIIGSAIQNKKFNKLIIKEDDTSIQKISAEEFPSKLLEKDTLAQSILITYSNKQALQANLNIRKTILEKNGSVDRGDLLMVSNTVPIISNEFSFQAYIHKGEIVKVLDVGDKQEIVHTLRNKTEIKLVYIALKIFLARYQTEQTIIILENHLLAEKDITPEEKQVIFLLARQSYKNSFGKDPVDETEFASFLQTDKYFNSVLVKYAYSITCHKANSLNWRNVFINCETEKAKDNEEYFRWLYTAICTAGVGAFLINFRTILPYSKIEWKDKFDAFDKFEKPKVNVLNADLNIDVPLELEDELKKLGLSQMPSFLKSFWFLISQKLKPNGISIKDIEHHSYQELYTFVDNSGHSVKIRFSYNAQGKISKHQLVPRNDFGEKIISILQADSEPLIHHNFPAPFLEEFYDALKGRLKDEAIQIESIDHHAYQEIYTLKRESDFMVLAVFYNGDEFIMSVMPTKFNSHTLYQKVKTLVDNKLR